MLVWFEEFTQNRNCMVFVIRIADPPWVITWNVYFDQLWPAMHGSHLISMRQPLPYCSTGVEEVPTYQCKMFKKILLNVSLFLECWWGTFNITFNVVHISSQSSSSWRFLVFVHGLNWFIKMPFIPSRQWHSQWRRGEGLGKETPGNSHPPGSPPGRSQRGKVHIILEHLTKFSLSALPSWEWHPP